MADISLGSVFTGLGGHQEVPIVAAVSETNIFWVFATGTAVQYRQSLDGGTTWQAAVDIAGSLTLGFVACWFDASTPGDTGLIVHTLYESSNEMFYVSFDLISKVAGTPVSLQTIGAGAIKATICKSRGGTLQVIIREGSTDFGFRSTDGGATWTATTLPALYAGTGGWNGRLVPGNEVNTNDTWLVEVDNLNQPRLHVYSSLTDSWTTTNFPTPTIGTSPWISVIVNPANNHALMSLTENAFAGAAPVSFFDINGATSINKISNVRDGAAGVERVDLAIREDTGRIYAFYGVHDGGSATNAVIKFRFSDDGGLTWSQEATWNEDVDGQVAVQGIFAGGPIPKAKGGRIIPVWDDTAAGGTDNAFTNAVKSIAVPAVVVGVDPLEDCPAEQDEFFVDSGLTCACKSTDTIISGLSHLEGQTVAIVVDKATKPSQVVVGGTLSFPDGVGGTKVQVGLAFGTLMETLPIEPQGPVDPRGKMKNIDKVRMRIHNGRGGTVAMKTQEETFKAEPIIPRKVSDPVGAAPPLFSGIVDLDIEGSADRDVRLVIKQDEPQPLTVLSFSAEVDIQDV